MSLATQPRIFSFLVLSFTLHTGKRQAEWSEVDFRLMGWATGYSQVPQGCGKEAHRIWETWILSLLGSLPVGKKLGRLIQ